jgi:hypothetical protein
MELEYSIDSDKLVITHSPWTGKILREPFIVKKMELNRGGPGKQVDFFFKTQLIPAKEELKELKTRAIVDGRVNTHARTILNKTQKTLNNLNKIKKVKEALDGEA